MLPIWCSDLNQRIRNMNSKVLIWIKWLTIHALKSWSESNDSQYTSQSRDLNNDSPDLMFRSKSNDSRDPLQSPNLNQMICDMCSKIPIWTKRFTNLLRSSHLIQVIRAPRSIVLKSNYSWSALQVLIWIMICEQSFQILTLEHVSQILKLKLALKFLY